MGITYIITTSQVGQLLVAGTSRGVCAVKLGNSNEILEQELQCEYPSTLTLKKCVTRNNWADLLVASLKGEVATLDLPLDIRATDFQWSVWQYLRTIPWGQTRSYQRVAQAIGRPKSVRAVAHACATNPVCLVIPCHRVIGNNGSLKGYRWGLTRKHLLLEIEQATNRVKN